LALRTRNIRVRGMSVSVLYSLLRGSNIHLDVTCYLQLRTPERNFTQNYSAVMTATIRLNTQAAEDRVTINTNSAWRLSVRLQCVNNLGQNPLGLAHHVHTAPHNIAWITGDRWSRVTVTWECPPIERVPRSLVFPLDGSKLTFLSSCMAVTKNEPCNTRITDNVFELQDSTYRCPKMFLKLRGSHRTTN
jgi:hypothetical protein